MTHGESSTRYELKPGASGRMTPELGGSLLVDSTARVWRELDRELQQLQPAPAHTPRSRPSRVTGARIETII